MCAQEAINPNVWYTEKEAARFLSKASATLKDWRHNSKGPKYYKAENNGDIRYKGSDLIEWQRQEYKLHEPATL